MSDDRNSQAERIVLSEVADDVLREVLARDPDNIALVMGMRLVEGMVHWHTFVAQQSLDIETKGLLVDSLAKAAEFVAACIAVASGEFTDPDDVEKIWDCHPTTYPKVAVPVTARLWRFCRKLIWKSQSILDTALEMNLTLAVGVRIIGKKRAEVVFEDGFQEVLNIDRKTECLEQLRRTAYAIEIRCGTSELSGSRK